MCHKSCVNHPFRIAVSDRSNPYWITGMACLFLFAFFEVFKENGRRKACYGFKNSRKLTV